MPGYLSAKIKRPVRAFKVFLFESGQRSVRDLDQLPPLVITIATMELDLIPLVEPFRINRDKIKRLAVWAFVPRIHINNDRISTCYVIEFFFVNYIDFLSFCILHFYVLRI